MLIFLVFLNWSFAKEIPPAAGLGVADGSLQGQRGPGRGEDLSEVATGVLLNPKPGWIHISLPSTLSLYLQVDP